MSNKRRQTFYVINNNKGCPCDIENWNNIQNHLEKNGWVRARNKKKASIILYKGCCMTTDEISSSLEGLVKLSKQRYDGTVYIGDCISRSEDIKRGIKESLKGLKIVFFNDMYELFQLLGVPEKVNKNQLAIAQNMAVINISVGCKRRCAFCKMCYMDYPFYSIPMDEIIAKIRAAKDQGIRMINLSAMNATEYLWEGNNLADLLKAILAEVPDMWYHLSGIVIAELTDEMLEVIKDPHILILQLEIQSFIPEVRKNMNVGVLSKERILHVLEVCKDKCIVSCIMTGFFGENNKNFKEQLEIIKENNLFFLTVNTLIPTPGTDSANFRNPINRARERVKSLQLTLMELRKQKAKELLGHPAVGVVMNKLPNKTIVLLKGGIFVETTRQNVEIGDVIEVIPKTVELFFQGPNQLFLLSTEPTKSSKLIEELKTKKTGSIVDEMAYKVFDGFKDVYSPEEIIYHMAEFAQTDQNYCENVTQKLQTLYEFVKEEIVSMQ